MRKERRELSRREQPRMDSSPSISAPPLSLMVFTGVLFFFLLLENEETYKDSGSSSTLGFLQHYLLLFFFVLLYVHVTMRNARWLSRPALHQSMRGSDNGSSGSLWGLLSLLVLVLAMLRHRVFFIFLFAFLFLLWSYTG